ncbi:MAG: discoidin domain-containing protein [Tepidisphaeraceae bacterium]|jgi:ribosomal protein L19
MFARRTAALAAAGLFALVLGGTAGAEDAPLDIKIPKPAFSRTPKDLPPGLGRLERPTGKPRPPFLAPKGCRNLALNRPATSSDPEPIIGKLEQVTDGDKEGVEGSWVELGPGKQWVQIDLGEQVQIYAIIVWHNHSEARVYKGVVVQVSDNGINHVQTVFNNDQDNSVGLGIGEDLQYFENNEGKLIDTRGVKGRYVRLWSKGNTTDDQNHYTEVEVWGIPTAK